MATNDDVSELSFEDLVEINSELVDFVKQTKKQNKELQGKLNRSELEVSMLRDEKKIPEEELEMTQESNSNLTSQLSMITQELEIQKNKTNDLSVEIVI